MKLLNTFAILFAAFAGLTILNRFYDLLPHIDTETVIYVVGYSLYPLVVVLIGLFFFRVKVMLGYWILLLFQVYILFMHGHEYISLMWPQYEMASPDFLHETSLPFWKFIFPLELLFGLLSLGLLVKIHRKMVAESS